MKVMQAGSGWRGLPGQAEQDFLRREVEKTEEEFFEIQGPLKVQSDIFFFHRVLVAVSFEDIVKPLGQRHHLIVAHPFIGIEDNFLGSEQTSRIRLGAEIFQHHMLGHDLTELRVPQFNADPLPYFGMVAGGVQTEGLGDVMEQCPCRYFGEIRQGIEGLAGSPQAVDQCPGDPSDYKGMGSDIIEHFIAIEKLQTLTYGRDVLCHTYYCTGRRHLVLGLSAAQFMDRVYGNFCLLRRGELVNAVAEIENMTVRVSGIFQQSADSFPQPVFR